jgi:hypothetical protein
MALLPAGSVLDMHDPQVASRAKGLGTLSVPAVVIDGNLADCCTGRGQDEAALRATGLAPNCCTSRPARGAAAIREERQSEETVRKRVQTRRERGCPPPVRWAEDGWKPEEVALLGTTPDEELARQLGRSLNSVSLKRRRLKIANPRDRCRRA